MQGPPEGIHVPGMAAWQQRLDVANKAAGQAYRTAFDADDSLNLHQGMLDWQAAVKHSLALDWYSEVRLVIPNV